MGTSPHDDSNEPDEGQQPKDQGRDFKDVKSQRVTVPSQNRAWGEERNEVSCRDRQNSIVEWDDRPEMMLVLDELAGKTGVRKRLHTIPVNRHQEKRKQANVWERDKQELIKKISHADHLSIGLSPEN